MPLAGLEFAGTERYRVIRLLGEGGMGMVYEAEDTRDNQRLALKVIKHGDVEEIYRLKREFRALADLSHPNLVDLYDLVADERSLFLTMELVEGVAFVQHCRGGAPTGQLCDEQRLRPALIQLVRGLGALHAAGKIHRDIKPSNVLVTEEGRVVVLDFGLVGDMRREIDSLAGRIVGTIEYMAPEQAAGEAMTPAADWYSLGVLLYETLTGRPPFAGGLMEVLLAKQQHPPAPPRALVPQVSEDLDELCVALLARVPEQRPPQREILRRLGADAVPELRPTLSSGHSLTQPIPFCGREEELARLHACADEAGAGRAAVAYLRGPSGIGKSALIAQFLTEVRRRDERALVLQGRCYERETVPYKAMDAVIDQLSQSWAELPRAQARALVGRNTALLPRLFPVLGRVPAVLEAEAAEVVFDPQELRTRAFSALRSVLAGLAASRPVVIVLDDLQWIDDDSVTLLADLMRPPEQPGLLLLLSSRDETDAGDDGSVTAFEQLLRALGPSERIELGPLAAEAALRVAGRILGEDRLDVAQAVVDEAAGSPFLLGELARHAIDRPTAGHVDIADVLRTRIARLPERAQAVLQLVTVAGEPVSQRVAATALDCAPEELRRIARLLRTSQLLRAASGASDRIEPYHDRIREHVRAELPRERRQDLHRALALALERWSEASPERLARHWHGAEDRARAAEYAREAADEAAGTLDFSRAARLYRLALATGEYDARQRRELLSALGDALVAAGRAREGAAALQQAAGGAEPAIALELQQRSAQALLLGGYVREGLAALEAVLDQLGLRLAPTPRAALVSMLRRRAWLRIRGLRWQPRSDSEISQRDLTAVDARYTVAMSLSVVDNIRGAEFQARHLLAALRLGEPLRVSRALAIEAGFLATMGKTKRARRLADLADRILSEVEGATPPPFSLWARGAIEYFTRNDWAAAREFFVATEETVRSYGRSDWALDTAQIYRCFADMYLGNASELARRVPQLLQEAERRGDLYLAVNARARLGLTWLAGDTPAVARDELREAMARWTPPDEGFHVQHWFALSGGLEIELYRGDLDAAARLLGDWMPRLRRSLLSRLPLVDAEARFLEGRLTLAQLVRGGADADAARARVLKVIRTLDRSPLPLAAWAAELLRVGELATRDADQAVPRLRALVERLEGSRTLLFANAARRRLGELCGGDEGAALVAEGDAWMRQQEVRNPRAMTRMLLW